MGAGRIFLLSGTRYSVFVSYAGITCDVSTAFAVRCPPDRLHPLLLTVILHLHPFNLPCLFLRCCPTHTLPLFSKMTLADFIEKTVPLPLPHYITHYVAGQTPISTNKAVATALVSYLAVIFGLQELMKTRQPLKLNALFQLHNMVLTLGSGLLLACMVEEVVPILWRTGLFNAVCSTKSWTPVRAVHLSSPPLSQVRLCHRLDVNRSRNECARS